MKKMILILAMVGVTGLHAQNKEGQRTVSVSGSAPLTKAIEAYRIKATLSMDQVYYADTRLENLAQLKKQYFSMVTDSGVDTSKFTEKEVEYYATGYQRDGTVLYYETPSKEIAMKLAKTNMQGVQMQFQIKEKISQEQTKTALEEALKDAKANAEQLCKTIGTAVGEIISISSNHYDTSAWVSYYSDYEQSYSVSVIYEMK
ncbi:MAG: SIMPL domain-containing protein [Maribacter sp.]